VSLERLGFCWLLILALVACASARPRDEPRRTVREILLEDPAYRAATADPELHGAFQRYWAWLGGLGVPDVEYLEALPPDDLEHLAMLYHEEVELRAWLRLGHRLDDVMTKDYYQQRYPEVYPVAHAEAMAAELALLAGFATRAGFPRVPERAFVLVGPMVERRGVAPAMVDRRLKFNPAIAAQAPTRDELETAARVYEAGGYRYRDRNRVIEAARDLRPMAPPP
jgi:hypothetical protein